MLYLWRSKDNLWESDLTTIDSRDQNHNISSRIGSKATILLPTDPSHQSPCLIKFMITVPKIKYHRTYFHNLVNKYLLKSFPQRLCILPLKILDTYILLSFYLKIPHLLHSVYQVFLPTPYSNYLSLRHIKLLIFFLLYHILTSACLPLTNYMLLGSSTFF